jgi:3D (Asp-Asp-Asp) domain-containing protein
MFGRNPRPQGMGSRFASARTVGRLMTIGRRQVGLVMLLVAVDACAHRMPPAAAPQAPAGAAAPSRFTATAYCLTGLTATGVAVSKGVVAADPAVLPLGTVIRITGAAPYDGTYRVLDTGARIRRQRVDLFIPDCGAARRFGRRPVHVTVVRKAR